MNPDVRRLTVGEVKLLLAILGYPKAYGFLETETRRLSVQERLARLLQKGVMEREEDKFVIQQPYRDWINAWGSARSVLRIQGKEDSFPGACLYPFRRDLLACVPCRSNPEILRLWMLSTADLPDWLVEECGFPSWEEALLPLGEGTRLLTGEERDILSGGKDPDFLESCLYTISCEELSTGENGNRILIMQRPLYRELLALEEGGAGCYPYDKRVFEQIISLWLGGREENVDRSNGPGLELDI